VSLFNPSGPGRSECPRANSGVSRAIRRTRSPEIYPDGRINHCRTVIARTNCAPRFSTGEYAFKRKHLRRNPGCRPADTIRCWNPWPHSAGAGHGSIRGKVPDTTPHKPEYKPESRALRGMPSPVGSNPSGAYIALVDFWYRCDWPNK